MLAGARKIPQIDREMRGGAWPREMLTQLCGKTLGVFGTGSIGARVAELGRGLGMEVLTWSARRDTAEAKEGILRRADFVTLHVRLTPQTTGFVGQKEFALMKPGAILVNTGRGALVDRDALLSALATGTELKIDRYGEYRDGITLGTLEELAFAYATKLGAPKIEQEPQRPAGYEETGGVSHDVPGVGVNVFSSRGSFHTKEMEADAFDSVGHTGFRLDAQIMAVVLFDYLTDSSFREAVKTEHSTMKGLFGQYQENLRKAYTSEIGPVSRP